MNLRVVPANAGTHNLRLAVREQRFHKHVETPEVELMHRRLWVPAFAGTTWKELARITSLLPLAKRHRRPQIPSREWWVQ
jgi:hypothetical protein